MREFAFRGFGVKNYRSFSGNDMTVVGPFDKIHVITGRNNTGKSSLVDFACNVLAQIPSKGISELTEIQRSDIPMNLLNSETNRLEVCIGFSSDSVIEQDKFGSDTNDIGKALSSLRMINESSICWFTFKSDAFKDEGGSLHLSSSVDEMAAYSISASLRALCTRLCSSHTIGEGSHVTNAASILSKIFPRNAIPPILKIEAIRDVTPNPNHKESDPIISGHGLPNALNHLRNPTRTKQRSSRRRYKALLDFIRTVMDDDEIELLVPADASEINLRTSDTDYLPIDRLGTGVSELAILASIIACNEDKLLCIEEPEIHLHAAMQERFMRYLKSNTDNRFILTTHSPTIINANGTTITHVSKSNSISSANSVTNNLEVRTLLSDMGIKSSDLLQSNYIVWVEGPSDRIYVNHWINAIDSSLEEGMHYSIVTYGGKLLSGFEASPSGGVDSLISLFRVNPNFGILIDSDRPRLGAKINSTKQRIRKECEESESFAWITDGRTIENYIPEEVLSQAISEVYPSKSFEHALSDRYICPLSFTFNGVTYGPNKIDIARKTCEIDYELSGDLLKNATKLVERIRAANCM